MKNKHFFLYLSLLLILVSSEGFGQRWKLQRYEASVGIGTNHFFGDIGPAHQEFRNFFNGVRPNISLGASFRITPSISAKLDLGYLNFAGQDDEESSHSRVYSFSSHNFEHIIRGEYYILSDGRAFWSSAVYNRRGMVNNYNNINIYLFTGLGGILSKGSIKDLNNGGLPPDNNPGYNNNLNYGLVIPVGAGIKMSLSSKWSLGLEAGYRWTTSDLLDTYNSDWSKYNDTYYTIKIEGMYKIRSDRKGRPIFRKYGR